MKTNVFLSSTTKDLRDARKYLRNNLEPTCQNRINLCCFENDSCKKPHLSMQDACLSLVQDCEAIIIIIDWDYGTEFEKNREISITHAELREARKHDLKIIPLIRTQTFCEYWIWRNNPNKEIKYNHVKDPKVFTMLDEVSNIYCHVFDDFTDERVLEQIADTIDAIIMQSAAGTLNHVTLPSLSSGTQKDVRPTPTEPVASEKIATYIPEIDIPRFSNGDKLTADHMSKLFQAVYDAVKLNGLPMKPLKSFKTGDAFKPDDLNGLVGDIEEIYKHLGRTHPDWSFSKAEIGSIFEAAHMNEIVESVRAIL